MPSHQHSPKTIDKIHHEAQARNIDISRRQLESILADIDPSDVGTWVGECLQEEALLGRDELKLPFPESNGDTVLPLRESDFQSATKSLNASTTALEAQARVLRTQQRNLQKLASENRERRQAERRELERLAKKRKLEAQGLRFKVDDLRSDIDSTLKKHRESLIPIRQKAAFDLVATALEQDDQALEDLNDTLSSFPSLFPNTSSTAAVPTASSSDLSKEDDTEDKASLSRIEKLTALLSHYTIEEITSRLDVIYLQHLLQASSSSSMPLSSSPPIAGKEEEDLVEDEDELVADLNSLHAEIPTVTSLYISSTFRSPLERAITQRAADRRAEEQARLQDAGVMLRELTERLGRLTERVVGFGGYKNAVGAIAAALDQILVLAAKAKADMDATTTQLLNRAAGHAQRSGGGGDAVVSKPKSKPNSQLDSLLSYLGLPSFQSQSPHQNKDHDLHLQKALRNRLRKSHLSIASLQPELYGPLTATLAELKSAEESLAVTLSRASSGATDADADITSEEEAKDGDMEGEMKMKALETRLGAVGRQIEDAAFFLAETQRNGNGGGEEIRRARSKFISRWGDGGQHVAQ